MSANSSNKAALDAVDKLIDELNQTIQRYDDLTEQKAKLEAALAESQQLEKTTLADESLDHQTATERLVNSRAKNDVLKVRLQSHEQKIADQLKSVIAAGQLAQSAGYAVWHQMHQHRIQRSHDLFRKNFQLPWGSPISLNAMLADSSLAKEVLPLRTTFEFDRTHPIGSYTPIAPSLR
jgi:hypothetical protein